MQLAPELDVHPGRRTALPECPICRSHRHFRRVGWQDYSTDAGPVRSQILHCSACNLGLRDFAGQPAPLAAHFRSAWYSTDSVEQLLYDRRAGFYRHLLDLLNSDHEGQKLLDVGCGFGHFLRLARVRGFRTFGCELDADFAARAQARCGCPVRGGGLSALRGESNRFDVITFVDSFYYFDDPVGVLRECAQRLTPRGRVLIRATNRNHLARLYRWKTRLLGSRDGQVPFHTTDDAVCCHSRRSLAVALDAAGFDIEHMRGTELGKRQRPGLPTLLLTAAQWIERISCGTINASSGITVVARRREAVRAVLPTHPEGAQRRPAAQPFAARGA